jgi:ribulose 1,5-bisphosphate synthetase/thiazole synthase
MEDNEGFDGIINGACPPCLMSGTYLAKAGPRIALLERRMVYGGGLMTQEVTVPCIATSTRPATSA